MQVKTQINSQAKKSTGRPPIQQSVRNSTSSLRTNSPGKAPQPAMINPGLIANNNLLQLHQRFGNQAVGRMVTGSAILTGAIQRKEIREGDEANTQQESLLAESNLPVQRAEEEEGEEETE